MSKLDDVKAWVAYARKSVIGAAGGTVTFAGALLVSGNLHGTAEHVALAVIGVGALLGIQQTIYHAPPNGPRPSG